MVIGSLTQMRMVATEVLGWQYRPRGVNYQASVGAKWSFSAKLLVVEAGACHVGWLHDALGVTVSSPVYERQWWHSRVASRRTRGIRNARTTCGDGAATDNTD
uniref:Uncharacterized protein n=1 Tax=Oryza punctata TaxID=4537 RepID=A0A0E0JLG9_ORYPU